MPIFFWLNVSSKSKTCNFRKSIAYFTAKLVFGKEELYSDLKLILQMDSLLAVHKNDTWITADVLLVTFYELVAGSTDNLVKKDPSKVLIILTGVKNKFLKFYKL